MKRTFSFFILFIFFAVYFLNAHDLNELTYIDMISIEVEETTVAEIRYNSFILPTIFSFETQQFSEHEIHETKKSANARNNRVTAEVSLVNIGLRYERMLTPKISLGANVFVSFGGSDSIGVEPGSFGIDTSFRFYPWSGAFFIGLGLGYYSFSSKTIHEYHYHNVDVIELSRSRFNGLAVIPEVGWKIDVGRVGGLFLQFGFAGVLPLGGSTRTVEITGNNNIIQTLSYQEFFALPIRTLYFGIGFSF